VVRLIADVRPGTLATVRRAVPSGLRAVGYSTIEIPSLVEGTLPQERIVKISPRPVTEDDLACLLEESIASY
jgi:hydroxyacid-oxoacid transhydrogenase